jgi:hypothetical protein
LWEASPRIGAAGPTVPSSMKESGSPRALVDASTVPELTAPAGGSKHGFSLRHTPQTWLNIR